MSSVKYTTTCPLALPRTGWPCGMKFLDTGHDIPIIGEPAENRTRRFIAGLNSHLHSKHPDVAAKVDDIAERVLGMVVLDVFQTEDPGLLEGKAAVQYHLHQMTRRVIVDDDGIRAAVEEIPLTKEGVFKALIDLRNLLMDIGPPPPENPGNQPQPPAAA